jgi:hypothetical protein
VSTPTLSGVTGTVTDAWSTGSSTVHDLASSAADLATTAAEVAATVAVAAVEQLEELPERVVGLASAAKGRIGPTPRRSYKPWVLVAAGITAFVVVAWLLRRRSSTGPSVDYGATATDTYRTPGEPPASVAGN